MRLVTLVGVPFYTLSRLNGLALAVRELRRLGIDHALASSTHEFADLGDVTLPKVARDQGISTLKNFRIFKLGSEYVRKTIRKVDESTLLFCLGGECSLVVGTLAGLRSRFSGRPGILWMDAHGDFNTPQTTPSGYLGGMGLAFACGRGPALSSRIEQLRPLVSEDNVVHIGSRALDPLEEKAMRASRLRLYSMREIRRRGILWCAKEATDYLAEKCDWILCHLDVDVLDPSVMPAVNFPERQGLNFVAVKVVINALRRTGKLRAFDLAAYDPKLDPSRKAGQKLVDFVGRVFI